MASSRVLRTLLLLALVVVFVPFAFAQQTGAIHGRVTASDGSALPGVTVEARSPLLPQARVSNTDSNGDYRLLALLPGNYTVTYTLAGMQTVTRKATVVLAEETNVDVKLGVQGVSETVTVTARATLVEKDVTTLQNGLSSEQIQQLPVAQNYGDLQKLIPGVMYSQDTVRGPSSGGSGQSNVYLFDGANVTMPLFGVLVSEPATHDIASVNIIKGGANAVDFFRAGGFQIDSVSKSGTNRFSGEAEYQVLNHQFTAAQLGTINSRFQQDNSWATLNLGGPILADRLFFYGSYYRPVTSRNIQSNLYGPLPSAKSTRNEEFGKLTFTPTSAFLFNGSYRYSKRTDTADIQPLIGASFAPNAAATTGASSSTRLQIGALEGSWIPNGKSFGTFKLTDFRNPGVGKPDHFVTAPVSTAIGSQLDLTNLDHLGLLTVPTILAATPGNAVYNAFVQPYINKYGYLLNGTPTGGGTVGFNATGNNNDSFFRKSGQIGYNYTLGTNVTNDLHVGYQRYNAAEDLFRTSNGLGSISIPGGPGSPNPATCPASACGTATPAYFVAALQQQGVGVPTIHSEFHSQNIELNDQIHMNNWTFNVGVLASNDTLYGQGLAKADNIAGFVKSPGTKYKMHDIPFSQMMQPRLGATWAYNGVDTLYASYAQYNPDANSDARAASWDRNLVTTINAYYDSTGKLLGVDPVQSSSGKLFVSGIKPPQTREVMLGTAKQITPAWSARLYGRYRKSDRFWEDTNNNARIRFNPPPGVPQTLYIPDLAARIAAIGSGSTYVIAELDGAFTKYYEMTMEQDWHGKNLTLHASYTLSHYYGNFDQDHSTATTNNDAAIFIGSSFIGDGAGRQLWNYKYGDLAGDRRNIVKGYGTYNLSWQATVGTFFTFQSGQPYQIESVLPYRSLTGSTSDTSRYAEPAGSRRTPATIQTDLNYTQNFPMPRGLNLQVLVDLFNVFNNQTGYNYESRVGSLGACTATSVSCIASGIPAVPSINTPHPLTYYAPRRYQIAARVQF